MNKYEQILAGPILAAGPVLGFSPTLLISTRVIKNLFNNFENIKKEWVELKKTGDAF